MKKLLVFCLAALLVVAFSVPASALENVFGGYWRTRGVVRQDFDGDDTGDQDIKKVDTRTRLYYTAILNDNLKFVNKFEFDAHWGKGKAGESNGGLNQYGDFGADGKSVEVKESYVEFNLGPVRNKVGIFNPNYGRGFIWDDEGAGLEVMYISETMRLPFNWFKGYEGYVGDDQNDFDVDVFGINPVFTVAESWNIQPHAVWMYSKDASEAIATGGVFTPAATGGEKTSIWYFGVNVDGTIGPASVFFTGIYQTGSVDDVGVADVDMDVSAYVVALGGSVPLGPASVHSQFFYASGDDDPLDDDLEAYFGVGGGGVGQAYYWSEIMGLGRFDWDQPTGTPGADVSNIWALNLGASIAPFDKLTLTGDLWYAKLVEDNAFDEDELGFEVDLVATYQLVEGMNLDLVAAYLWAGDAVSADGNNKENPYELGWRLSLAF